MGKLNSAMCWPMSAEERALATKQEKENLKQLQMLTMHIEKAATNKKLPSKYGMQ